MQGMSWHVKLNNEIIVIYPFDIYKDNKYDFDFKNNNDL